MLSWGGTGRDTEPLTPLGWLLSILFPEGESSGRPCVRFLGGFGCERPTLDREAEAP